MVLHFLLLHDLGQHDALAARLRAIVQIRVHGYCVHIPCTAARVLRHADKRRVGIGPVPRLVPLNKNRDATVGGVRRHRGLDHDSTGVLLELASHFVVDLRVLAVIGVVGHVSVLV